MALMTESVVSNNPSQIWIFTKDLKIFMLAFNASALDTDSTIYGDEELWRK